MSYVKQAKQKNLELLIKNEPQASALYLGQLTQEYIKNSSSIENIVKPDEHKYLIFLQMQPESTTVPCAMDLSSQLNLIQKVRSIIPNNAKLLVKEHSAQFAIFSRNSSPQ